MSHMHTTDSIYFKCIPLQITSLKMAYRGVNMKEYHKNKQFWSRVQLVELSTNCTRLLTPVSIAARSKGWACGSWLAGTAGSNPAGDMDIYRVCAVLSGRCLCVKLVTRRDQSYRVCVCVCVCLSVILKPQQWGRPDPLAVAYPGILFEGSSTNSVDDRVQGSGGGSPLVRGSGSSCNYVKKFHFI